MKKTLYCLVIALSGIAFQGNAQTILFENFSSVTTPALPAGWGTTFTALPGTTPQGWVTITSAADYYCSGFLIGHPQYAECTELYYPGNDPANLTTPSFSLVGTTTPMLSFDYWFDGYHYYSGGIGYFEHAYVQISTDGGTTWTVIDTLPGEPAYWNTVYINLAAYADSPDCKLNFQYTNGGGTISMDGFMLADVKVYTPLPNEINLSSISPKPITTNFFTASTGISIGGVVDNISPAYISSFSATYQVGAGAPVTSTFTGLSIAPFTSYAFTCPTPYTTTIYDPQLLTLWVTEAGNPDPSQDTLTTNVHGVTHYPVNIPVGEEATATWCDGCPEGIISIDSFYNQVHDAMSFICGHIGYTSDPMVDYNYGSWLQSQAPSWPYLLFDRLAGQAGDPGGVSISFHQYVDSFAYADISMSATISGDTLVTVPVSITAATNLYGVYKLALVLTEDNVHNTVTPGQWDQYNLYSGGASGPMQDAEYNFVLLPNPVPAPTMYYNHVERSITPGVNGGHYLPDTMLAGTTYSYTFTAPIATGTPPDGWVIPNMHAVVMLIDSASGNILNSANMWLITPTQTAAVTAPTQQVNIYPNPAYDKANIQFDLTTASNVQVNITDMLGRTLYTTSNLCMPGSRALTVSTSNFPPGLYNVKIIIGTTCFTKQLSVIR